MSTPDLGQQPAALQRLVVRLGLAAADEAIEPIPLPGGVSSGIYLLRLRGGEICIKQALPRLKVAKEWLVPVDRVFHEVAYLREAGTIVPGHVPRVIAEDRETRSFAMEFLGPGHVNWKAELLAGRVDPRIAAVVGDVLGRIHAATADRPSVAQRFATDANFHAIRLEPYLVESARVHPEIAGELHALVDRTAGTRRVLVHGDVSPKNTLIGPRGPVLLDAECAWFGDPAFDVAFCLNHFLLKAIHQPGNAAALLAAYACFAAAYLARVAWEDPAVLGTRASTLLPGLALGRVDGKSPVEYLDGAQRERVRSLALGLLRDPATNLESLARRWEGAIAP